MKASSEQSNVTPLEFFIQSSFELRWMSENEKGVFIFANGAILLRFVFTLRESAFFLRIWHRGILQFREWDSLLIFEENWIELGLIKSDEQDCK